jgi:hypothetical protein
VEGSDRYWHTRCLPREAPTKGDLPSWRYVPYTPSIRSIGTSSRLHVASTTRHVRLYLPRGFTYLQRVTSPLLISYLHLQTLHLDV